MPEKTKYIYYDNILDIALKGVRRTAVFLGLGLNAASNPDFVDYSLTDVAPIQIIPADADDETIKHFKEDFSIWIVSCGLRELIETFNVFLDGIFYASLIVAISKGDISNERAVEFYQKFTYVGTGKKFEVLEDRFNVRYKYSDYVCTVNMARNCLTHRLGRVAPKDCNDNDKLLIKWLGFEIYFESKSGETIKPELPIRKPFRVEGGVSLMSKFAEKSLAFNVGSTIRIPPKSLAEICFFLHMAATVIRDSAIEYAVAQGIKKKDE